MTSALSKTNGRFGLFVWPAILTPSSARLGHKGGGIAAVLHENNGFRTTTHARNDDHRLTTAIPGAAGLCWHAGLALPRPGFVLGGGSDEWHESIHITYRIGVLRVV